MNMSSLRPPSLAVIMPNYNDGPMIEASVAGVLAQEQRMDELVIIDDGSTDNSREIIRGLAARHPQIRVLENPGNQGVVYSFNRALEVIDSEYVAFVSMDDWTSPDWLKKSMDLLTRHPQAGLCCSDLYFVRQDQGNARSESRCNFSPQPAFLSPRDFPHALGGHYISGTTVVVKKSALLEVGGYRPELKWHSDWFAWLVIAMRYGACYLPECLVSLRVRNTSHSEVGRPNWALQREVLKNILTLLSTAQFIDVVPAFITGRVMNHFGLEGLRLMLEMPELWSPLNALLLTSMRDSVRAQTGWAK